MELIKSMNNKGKFIALISFVSLAIYLFILWADSPGDIKFYLNRNSNDVYNESSTFHSNQKLFYRFVQTLETESYQLTIIEEDSKKIYDTQTIDVPPELIQETALSGVYQAPSLPGIYIMKVQDIKNDILVAKGKFAIK